MSHLLDMARQLRTLERRTVETARESNPVIDRSIADIFDTRHFQIAQTGAAEITITAGSWRRNVNGTIYRVAMLVDGGPPAVTSESSDSVRTKTVTTTKYIGLDLGLTAGIPTSLDTSLYDNWPDTLDTRVLAKIVCEDGVIASVEAYWWGGDIDDTERLDILSLGHNAAGDCQIFGWAAQAPVSPGIVYPDWLWSDAADFPFRHAGAGTVLEYVSILNLARKIASVVVTERTGITSYIDLTDTDDVSYNGKFGWVPMVHGPTPPDGTHLDLVDPNTSLNYWPRGCNATAGNRAWGDYAMRTDSATDWAISFKDSLLTVTSTDNALDWKNRQLIGHAASTISQWSVTDATDASSRSNTVAAALGIAGGLSVAKTVWANALKADNAIELEIAGHVNRWTASDFYIDNQVFIGIISAGNGEIVIDDAGYQTVIHAPTAGTLALACSAATINALACKDISSAFERGLLVHASASFKTVAAAGAAGDLVLCIPAT